MLTFVIYPAPSSRKETRFGYSISCLTLATMAKKCGAVRYYDFSLEKDIIKAEQRFFEEIRAVSSPRVVLYFDSVPLHRSNNVDTAKTLCAKIRETVPDAFIVACGPYCMLSRNHITFSNITIIDEPEISLLTALIGERDDHCLVSGNDSRSKPALLESLIDLPSPDRSLLPAGAEFSPRVNVSTSSLSRSAVVSTTRGCIGACKFCPRRAWNNGLLRHRSLEQVVDEIGGLFSAGYRNIWLDDDNMGADPEWTCELFDRIAPLNIGRRCGLYISVWGNTPCYFFAHAAAAGVRIVSFGVESASEKVLRFYGKPVTVDAMRRAFCAADKEGIFTVANVIIGASCEEDADLKSTLAFLVSTPVDDANIKILSYIYGSRLWDEAFKRGLIKKSDECVFADGLLGTSNRPLSVLVEQQKSMMTAFSNDTNRLSRLRIKMRSYGVPYRV